MKLDRIMPRDVQQSLRDIHQSTIKAVSSDDVVMMVKVSDVLVLLAAAGLWIKATKPK